MGGKGGESSPPLVIKQPDRRRFGGQAEGTPKAALPLNYYQPAWGFGSAFLFLSLP